MSSLFKSLFQFRRKKKFVPVASVFSLGGSAIFAAHVHGRTVRRGGLDLENSILVDLSQPVEAIGRALVNTLGKSRIDYSFEPFPMSEEEYIAKPILEKLRYHGRGNPWKKVKYNQVALQNESMTTYSGRGGALDNRFPSFSAPVNKASEVGQAILSAIEVSVSDK